MFWKIFKWLAPRMAVVLGIGFAVEWGGLFHGEFELTRGLASWFVIWVAVEYYRWHLNRYET